MDAFFKDLKYSTRMFLKSPGFTLTAVAAIALGIGGTVAIFSIVNTVLLKPIGVPEPERLVVLSAPNGGGDSPALFMHWRSESSVLQQVSAYSSGGLGVRPRLVGLFPLLGFADRSRARLHRAGPAEHSPCGRNQ